MEFTTSCPACGASLQIETGTRQVTCKYCGNQFDVDTSTALPGLARISPEEMKTEPLPEQSAQTESAEILPPPPPVPEEPFRPILPPPPAYTPVSPAAPRRPIATWVIIALGVTLLLCGLCACLLVAWNISNAGGSF